MGRNRSVTEMTPSQALRYFTVKITTAATPGGPPTGTGTGFFFGFEKDGLQYPLVITNKHVIENADSVELWFHEQDQQKKPIPGPGRKISAAIAQLPIIRHPDPEVDLVAIGVAIFLDECPKQQGWTPYFICLPPTMILEDAAWSDLEPVEEVTMVGYPVGLADQHNNLPIVRRGITATPASVNYQGKQEFLVDMAVFPGSSGSPVFLLNEGAFTNRGGLSFGTRFILLGVLYAGHQQLATGEIVAAPAPTATGDVAVIKQMVHLGLCIKSTRIRELMALIN
jgi:trypsin-like peptidase